MRQTLLAVGLVALAFAGRDAGAQTLTRLDWANDQEKFARTFKPVGIKPGRAVTVGLDGVSFEFGPLKGARNSGVRGEVTIRGDFEVAMKYELTNFPESSADGDGVMIGVVVGADPGAGVAGLKRGVFRGHGHQNRLTRDTTVDGARRLGIYGAPTASKHGRLVMRRVGAEVIGLSAETPDGELVEWKRLPFTEGPVRVVNFNADSGGSDAAFTARLYDLQIRTGADVPTTPAKPGPPARTIVPLAQDVVPVPAATAPTPTSDAAPAPTPPAPVRGGYWLVAVVAVVAFVLGVAVGRRWKGGGAKS